MRLCQMFPYFLYDDIKFLEVTSMSKEQNKQL